jgi:fructokinase
LFYRQPSADVLLSPNDLDLSYLSQAKVLHFGSLLMASEPSGRATKSAIELALQAGLLLSYDVNLRLNFWKDRATALENIAKPLDKVHMLKVNRAELEFLTGIDDPLKGSAQLWQANLKLLVVTLDAEGCFYRTANFYGFVPAVPVTVIDTVGAGDAFMAGLLSGIWAKDFNFSDENTVKFACARAVKAGAVAVSRKGTISSLPHRHEV